MPKSTSSDRIRSHLGAWLSASLGDVAVTLGPPGPDGGPAPAEGRAPQGINLHLLSIAPQAHATSRMERRTELHIQLRYLATSWAERSDAADSLLCALAFHLIGRGAGGPDGRTEIAVDSTPPAPEILTALGLSPRPALVVSIPLVKVEEAEAAPRVAHPPIVRGEMAAELRGIVLGPGDVPMAAATVEFPSLGLATETDPAGAFRFARVPADPAGQTIRVRARGIERNFQLPAVATDRALTLRMSFTEEG